MKKVFVVDDDKIMRKLIIKVLSPISLEIIEFEDAHDAVKEVGDHAPDLIFLDYVMPKMEAPEFLVKYSENKYFENRSLFIITGKSLTKDDEFQLYSLGVDKIFNKPFDKDQLLDEVKKYLKL